MIFLKNQVDQLDLLLLRQNRFKDPIDVTAPNDLSICLSSTDNSNSKLMAYSYNGKTSSTNTAIRRYIKIQLTRTGSGGASWEARDLSSAGSHPTDMQMEAQKETLEQLGIGVEFSRMLFHLIMTQVVVIMLLFTEIVVSRAGTTIPFGSSGDRLEFRY